MNVIFRGRKWYQVFLPMLAGLIILASCEKEVNINLNSGQPKLVVDGQIETNGYPVIILTKSIGYFSKIDLSTLENTFAHGAVVKVSDGIRTIQLREYSLDTGINGSNKFYLYSIDTSDPGALNFRGQTNRSYRLTIDFEGKAYESVTKIPEVKSVDSLWFRAPAGEPVVPTSMLMFVSFTDPDTPGNYLRYFTRRNSELFYPGFNSVYEDEIVNGNKIDSLNLPPGFSRARQPNFDSLYFFRGDTVTLKWCALDRDVYEFFRTFEYATGTIGNPFASPVNVISNIRGGALGIWAGYGASYITRIVP